MFPLLSLPTEIIVRILSPLDVEDAFSVQLANSQLRDLYRSTDLCYILRLKIHGMEDNPCSTWAMNYRSQMLFEREKKWSNCQHLYRLLDPPPRWAVGPPYVTDQYILYPMSLGEDMPVTGIQSFRVPIEVKCILQGEDEVTIETKDGVEVKDPKWSFFEVEEMVDFACCIEEHDLIAVVSYAGVSQRAELRVHFIQHSTGKPHPLAAKSDIGVTIEPPHPDLESDYGIFTSLELSGDNFIMTVETSPVICHLHVYNWQTGMPKTNPIPVSNTGLAFLRYDLFLVPDIQDHCIDIYHINFLPTPSVKRIHRLGLPTLQSGGIITSVSCRASPNPTGDGRFPKYIPRRRPFRDDPMDAVVFFEWDIALGEIIKPCILAVHRKSIINKLPRESTWSSLPPHDEAQIPIPWKEWGLNICRWFWTSYTFTNHTHGQRIVQWITDLPELPGQSFTLSLSFNPYHVKRAIANTIKRENNNSEDVYTTLGGYSPSTERLYVFSDMLREEDTGKLEATQMMLSTDLSVGTSINGLSLMPGSSSLSIWSYGEY